MHTLSTIAALALLAQPGAPGAEAAWTTLVERHGPDVWRLIASRQWDSHVAEDAYQEFWLALPQAARQFRPTAEDSESKAKAWLMAVAYRTAIDVHRRRKPAQAMTQEVPSTTESDMEDQDHRAHQLARIREALEQLPESYRQPVLLHLVGGLSYDDLAAELRCTVNNARVKVHRGLARLREQLGVSGGAGQLSERALAGMLVPPFLMSPPAAPALSLATVVPPPPGLFAAAGKLPLVAAAAKAPVLAGVIATAAAATTVTAAAFVFHPTPQEPAMPLRPAAVAALATLTTVASGAVLDDFERTAPLMESRSTQLALLSIVPAPSGQNPGSALRIGWAADHQNFVDCYYTKMIDAPVVTADGAAVATFKLWTEAYSGVQMVAIRFTDTKLESFQWSVALPDPGQTGWRTITIPLIPARNTGHWGPDGVADGVIDFPVKLNGYAVQFTSPTVPAGAVVIDDVAVTATATTH